MCENYLKSRLKKKKISVEHQYINQAPREALVRNPTARNTEGEQIQTSPGSPAWDGSPAGRRPPADDTEDGPNLPAEGTPVGPNLPAEGTPVGPNLPAEGTENFDRAIDHPDCGTTFDHVTAVEILWALMLEAFLSQPEKQSRHQVPELPRSSTESLILVANQDRCLDVEDVPPFPKSSAPPSSPAQTGGPAEPGDTRNVKTVSPHDHRAAPSSASLSSSVSDSKGSQHQTSVCGPDPAAVLQTCPMCCLLFPSGFSQMDQDRHLAKCLSEVRTDMTW